MEDFLNDVKTLEIDYDDELNIVMNRKPKNNNEFFALVVGPQHSCTRLIVALLDRHPDVNYVGHMGTNSPNFINLIKHYQKIIIVSRDPSCINKSNEVTNGIDFDEDVSTKATEIINKQINTIYDKHEDRIEDIHFISIESIIQYKTHVLKRFFQELGLNVDNYNYNLTGEYRPKDIKSDKNPDGQRWFTVNLNIRDCNKKYFK